MKKSLNILLGAGFSRLADLPLGNDIKKRFDRDQREQLLRFSGGEWAWRDGKDQTTLHNGSLGADWLCYSYLLDEIVCEYNSSKGGFKDYEDFYQFIKDHSGNANWYGPIYSKVKNRMYKEQNIESPNEFYDPIFNTPDSYILEEIVNHLIADMLFISKSEQELMIAYKPFIDYIKMYEEVHVFTLNHDLLVEKLLKYSNLDFCNGFTEKGSVLQYNEQNIPTFGDEFDSSNIKIYKLHGSVDSFMFEHCNENNGVLTRTDEYSYFKPIDYPSMHYLVRVDIQTGQVIQTFSPDTVVPRFITGNGSGKKDLISADFMYNSIYSRFSKQMLGGKELFVAGYSFGDEHVNDVFSRFTKESGLKVINLNPYNKFEYPAESVIEIADFSDLVEAAKK